MFDYIAFGALIRAKRGELGLTQAKLAEQCFGNTNRKGDISRFEKGRKTPQEDTVQKLCTHLNISEAELAPIRQSRLSAKQLDNIPGLSLDDLQILSSRFGNADAYDLPDTALRAFLTQKAEEYRIYRKQIDALDDRVAAIANLKGGAEAAADALNFDEVESLLSRVDEVETEIAAETKLARARNALLRGDPDHAFQILSAAADSFASIDPLEPAKRSYTYLTLLKEHGLRYPGAALLRMKQMAEKHLLSLSPSSNAKIWADMQIFLGNAHHALGTRAQDTASLQDAVTAYRAALEVRTRDASPMDWATIQYNLGNALQIIGIRAQDAASLQDAVRAYRASLEVQTRDTAPFPYAKTMESLALAHANLSRLPDAPDPRADLNTALSAVDTALTIFSPDHTPFDHARAIQNRDAIQAALKALP